MGGAGWADLEGRGCVSVCVRAWEREPVNSPVDRKFPTLLIEDAKRKNSAEV